ncbi:cytochrome c oxidase assembly protein [Nocardioides sp.]|uniref:cytochrome c oxidase assembly protein n=1 Tax=Nocardioides sp. TaxID=35761 RepID=UPI002869FC62|nr:cytochrome c oxidase assembly protein [Nocardioides sp.]
MHLAPRPRDRALATVLPAAVAAVTVGLLVLLGAGGGPVDLPGGLPDAGSATGWALRGAGLWVDLGAALTTGALLVATLLPERSYAGRARARALSLGRRTAIAWALGASVLVVLEAADTAGVPAHRLTPHLLWTASSNQQGAGLALTLLGAGGLALATRSSASPRSARLLLAIGLAALVPLAAAGHAASTDDPDLTVAALVVHVAAASLWVGGLAALLVVLRGHRSAAAAVLPRFSVVALGAFAALAGSGVIAALAVLDASVTAWTSPYAAVLALKAALLVGLGFLGHQQRRRALRQVADGRDGAFRRLAATELLLMGAAFGSASALSRTPVPQPDTATSDHTAAVAPLAPVSLARLVLDWRVDAIVVLALSVALAAYLHGVRRLARAGTTWPVTRTVAWTAGLLVALVDLCSGLGRYAPALLSAQVTQLLVALLVVPALLAIGAPLTLLAHHGRLPARRSSLWAHPLTGSTVVVALLLLTYRTPLIELSLRSVWTHELLLALAIVCGSILLWPMRGTGERALGLAVVTTCLLVLAVQLRLGDQLLAGSWFIAHGPEGADPVADQRLAGALVGVVAALSLLPMLRLAHRGGDQSPGGQIRTTTRPSRSPAGTAP